MTASNGTPTSKAKPSSVEDSKNQAHQLGANAGNELCKAENRISNIWRALGKDAANHADNASVSITKQTDFLNDLLQGLRESAPSSLVGSKNLGRSVGFMMESYLLARVKVFGNTASIPYFYQVAGSNEPARFHIADKPAKVKTDKKADAPKECDKPSSNEAGKKEKTESPEARKIALLSLIKAGLDEKLITMDDVYKLTA
jgi:hypothetical protein